MVDSTSFKTKLVDFSDIGQNEEFDMCNSAFNSFMIRLDDFKEYKEVNQLTQCDNCKAALTDNDQNYIDDWNVISQNEKYYADIPEKIRRMKEDPWAFYIWECRFCANKNLVRKKKLVLAPNRSKVIVRDGIPRDFRLNYCPNPLLLFLVDSSSSMDEQITEFSDPKNWTKDVHTLISQSLKKTKIYQKIVKNEEERLKNLRKLYNDAPKDEYVDHLTKNKVLMALLEISIKEIKEMFLFGYDKKVKLNNSIYDKKEMVERRVGFIFFNSDVIIHQKQEIINVSDKSHNRTQIGTFSNPKADFNSFRDLFDLGLKYSDSFGQQISKFDFDDLNISRNMINPTGQTALGPAISIASGIVNNYGPGSLVVVITDGRANKGIFKEDQLFNNEINLLNMKFDRAKAEVCIIQIDKKSSLDYEQKNTESSLSKYARKYCQKILIQLDNKQSPFEMFKNRLRDVIGKTREKCVVNEVIIKCENQNVDYDSNLKNIKKKLFNSRQYQFIAPKINVENLKSIDYKHLFMTQIIVKYQDLQTKKQEICLTYMLQKLVRYKQMTKKQRENINSTETLMNVLTYLAREEKKLDLQNIPLTMTQLSFKSMIQTTFTMSINRENKINMMKNFDEDKMTLNLMSVEKPLNPKQMIKSIQLGQEEDDFRL